MDGVKIDPSSQAPQVIHQAQKGTSIFEVFVICFIIVLVFSLGIFSGSTYQAYLNDETATKYRILTQKLDVLIDGPDTQDILNLSRMVNDNASTLIEIKDKIEEVKLKVNMRNAIDKLKREEKAPIKGL